MRYCFESVYVFFCWKNNYYLNYQYFFVEREKDLKDKLNSFMVFLVVVRIIFFLLINLCFI